MRATVWAALGLSAFALGCAPEKESPTPPPPAGPKVAISASAASVVANGTNTVAVTVSDTGGAAVTVTTTRGTFEPGGLTSTTVPGGVGTVTLRTCNETTAGCAGTAVITASSTSGIAAVSITFGSLATVCPTNCAADPGCATRTCNLSGGGSGTCSGTSPSTCLAAPCTPTAESCGNGADDDCDGDVDCLDADCDGQACPGGATFVCQSSRCTDVSSGLAVTVLPARTRLPANGTTATVVEVEVTADAQPVSGVAVSVSTTLGAIAPAAASTDADGKARFTFTASAAAGAATITAQIASLPTVTGSATITMPRLGALLIVSEAPGSVQYPVMGVKDSGWRDYGWIQVQAIDDAGLPYPDDLAVLFEHRTLGGSTFADPSAATSICTASNCVAHQGLVWSGEAAPDTTGLANAWVYPGTVAGTLAFTATATAGGVTRSILLPTIAVVGAKASGSDFSVVCSPRNLPALAETDCAISLVDAPFSCEALLKDRFGNVLGREAQVLFRSEAAAIGQIVWTPAHDGGAGPQTDLGIAEQGFNTLGSGLPFDVAPDAGEPSVVHELDHCGTRTHNPRDGVVTIVAIADGEEAFWDANGNGSFDSGEPFVDLGEPFVDQDDNGQYDPGEWFLDVDGSGDYTLRNGTWDANTKIWTQTVVLYTAQAVRLASGPSYLGTRWANGVVDACTPTAAPTSFDVDAATTVTPPETATYTVVASDMNLNIPHAGTTYSVESGGTGAVDVEYFGLDKYADTVSLFYRYWPCADGGSGACASQCRASSAVEPCVMSPSLTQFSCGVGATAVITAGSATGPVFVDWEVDVPWNRYGSSAYTRTVSRLTGTVR